MVRRILIVEDDQDLASAEQVILKAEGYEAFHVSDGASALELLSRETVDLILLDVNMPHMDGHEVCRRLRQNPDTAHVNILMVTALGSVKDTITGLEAGADDYLPKPFEVPELLARVRAQLRLCELQERLVEMEKSATIGQMVITLSHEINNPLTSILWHAQLVQEWLKKEPSKEPSIDKNVFNSLQIMEHEAKRIEKVMEQLQSIEKPAVTEYLPGVKMIDIHRSESNPFLET